MTSVATAVHPSRRVRRPLRVAVGVASLAVASCAFGVLAFGVEAKDDDYITYWVAEQLARTGHLVNLNGAHVEQSSSLAYVVLLAVLYKLTHAPLPVLGFACGLGGLVATVALSARVAARVRPGTELAAAAAVAVAFPLVFWSTGGLETLPAAACVLWFVLELAGLLGAHGGRGARLARYTAASLLVVAARPDTMVVAVALAVVLLVLARPRARAAAGVTRASVVLATTVVVTAAVAVTVFRLVVFHRVLPQPELAKSPGPQWLGVGFSYVFSSLPWWLWVVALALLTLGVAWSWRARSVPGAVCAATFALGIGGLLWTRGDWMGAARLLVPYLAPGLVVMVAGAWSLRAPWRRVALGALVVAELAALVLVADGENWLSSQFTSADGPSAAVAFEADVGSPLGATVTSSSRVPPLPWYTAWDYPSTRDAVFLATATPVVRRLVTLGRGGPALTLGSYQAGMVPFTWQNDFPGAIRFVDMDGVVTDDFASCPGLRGTYGGEVITLAQWAHDAGRCAPPLPDLVLGLGAPSAMVGLEARYHVVAEVAVTYRQSHLVGGDVLLGNTEYLAARDGWRP